MCDIIRDFDNNIINDEQINIVNKNENEDGVCFACRFSAKKLIECNELESRMVSRKYCEHCLVGKEVPVYRRSLRIWSFGRVSSFRPSTGEHTVEFLDSFEGPVEREMVSIGDAPFRSYSRQRGDGADNEDDAVHTHTHVDDDNDVAKSTEVVPFDEDEYAPSVNSGNRRPPSVQFFADDPMWGILQDLIMDNSSNSDGNGDDKGIYDAATTTTTHLIGGDSDGDGSVDTFADPIVANNNDDDEVNNNNSNGRKRKISSLSHPLHDPLPSPSTPLTSPSSSLHCPPPPQHRSSNGGNKRSKKSVPCPWRPSEDEILLRAVASAPRPVRWPSITEHLPHRTPKQCRERYVNQLDPSLRDSDEWSAVEDAFVFNLYHTFGAQWSKIASLMEGRTDNAVKNRFHHLRRRMEKETRARKSRGRVRGGVGRRNGNDAAVAALGRRLQNESDERKRRASDGESSSSSSSAGGAKAGFRRKVADVVGHAAAVCLSAKWEEDDRRRRRALDADADADAESFRPAAPTGEQCRRCRLFAPSRQTGARLCRRTGWCETCVQLPTYACRDGLYDAVTLVAAHRRDAQTTTTTTTTR